MAASEAGACCCSITRLPSEQCPGALQRILRATTASRQQGDTAPSVRSRWQCSRRSLATRSQAHTGTSLAEAVQDVAEHVPAAVQQLADSSLEAVDQVQEAVGEALMPKELAERRRIRKQQKDREQAVYKFSAIAASLGVTVLAIAAVHYRFTWHARQGGEFPYAEAVATFLLTIGGVVGMELYARWAHKALWHDFQPGWRLHKSHHQPRVGPFEDNDIYAVANALPAMALCAYGFVMPTMAGGLCFGAGLGITLFGIMYMFVHDGLVHRRFPVGPIAEVPYLKRVAVAHQLHHSEKYGGIPWGMFFGPQELEAVGAKDELDRMCEAADLKRK